MTHKVSLSAIITVPPRGFQRPKPQPGETLANLVIRNFPDQWRGFVEEMRTDYAVPSSTSKDLLDGNLDAADLTVRAKIEDFITYRLPGYARTIKALTELQGDLGQTIGGFKLLQTVWPLERHSAGESAGHAYAKARGVEVLLLPPGSPGLVDLTRLLSSIRGQFAWIVPVGSRIEPFGVAIQLMRALRMFEADEALGMYCDGLYSAIYRLSVLRELSGRGLRLPPDPSSNTGLIFEAGYKAMSADPPMPFCHLEALYGGRQEAAHRNGISFPAARKWLQNLFEKPRQDTDSGRRHEQR